jgi:hypothetical protein
MLTPRNVLTLHMRGTAVVYLGDGGPRPFLQLPLVVGDRTPRRASRSLTWHICHQAHIYKRKLIALDSGQQAMVPHVETVALHGS